MKISVFTVIMPDSSVEEAACELREIGYDGVEWRVHDDYHISAEQIETQAAKISAISQDNGLEIPCLGTYLDISEPDMVERVLEAARTMQCPAVRFRSPIYNGSKSYHRIFDEALNNLKKIETLSRQACVKTLLEIHAGTIIPSASATLHLLNRFDPTCIGAIYDPANMIVEGKENWKMSVEMLGDYLAHVHVKNLAWFGAENRQNATWHWEYTPLNRGMVDWQEVISVLKTANYNGYLSVEDLYGTKLQTTGLIKEELSATCDSALSTSEKLQQNLDILRQLTGVAR